MFPSSSQRRFWTFKNEDEIRKHREKHNHDFQQYHGDRLGLNVMKYCYYCCARRSRRFPALFSEPELEVVPIQISVFFLSFKVDLRASFFLSPEEEQRLLKNYEYNLKEFCRRFEPPMLKCVVGTAFHYFKRFYLYNSPMDYHPKEILWVRFRRNLLCAKWLWANWFIIVTERRASILPAKRKNSMCRSDNSSAISKVTKSKRWKSFYRMNYYWCSDWIII